VSAGLDYKPGFWAQTDEIVRVVDVARPWRTAFPNHERLASFRGDSSLAGMTETIAIGERSGLTPVITHMKMLALDVGRVEEAFTLFGDAAARGVPVGIDSYP
jgi:N-acyl-D-amino-acid deacylase